MNRGESLVNHGLYSQDVESVIRKARQFSKLIDGSSILVTGATGMIGSFLVDVLMSWAKKENLNIDLWIISRSEATVKERFGQYLSDPGFNYVIHDLQYPLPPDFRSFDYIVHGAGNADPARFSADPVGTMVTNWVGTVGLLEKIRSGENSRFLYISTGEVYGQAQATETAFTEDYSGPLDILSPRSCYPSIKRAMETMIASYISQYDINAAVVRPCHIYGASVTPSDSRVVAQFMRFAVEKQPLLLKSDGSQVRSYCYVSDCISGLLTVLFKGKSGEAYNISNIGSSISIRELAELVCGVSGSEFIMAKANADERKGYSKSSFAVLSPAKLEALGWHADVQIKAGLDRSIRILSESGNKENHAIST